MKKLLFLLILFFPIMSFAAPADSIWIYTESFSCPYGSVFGICGGINSDLHNQFIIAIKKGDSSQAIRIWNKMSSSIDGSDNDTLPNYLMEPLFGNYEPEGIQIIPPVILAKKAYKGGIITLGRNYYQDFMLSNYSGYYISYMRYKTDGMLYVYNTTLIPLNSKQYIAYVRSYGNSGNNGLEKDLISAFNKGKFNNKDTNAVYQKLVSSIKDLPITSPSSKVKFNTTSSYFRYQNGIVQFKSYINGVGGVEWVTTDIDAATAVFSSPINGKDKYGSFYGAVRLKMNNGNIFVEPIGATSQISSLYFQDGKTDNVYVMGYGYSGLEVLSGAKASSLILLSGNESFSINDKRNTYCQKTDANQYVQISAIDSNFCYGPYGSTPGNNIESVAKRIK